MADIITVEDIPAAVQSNELVDAMLAGANARAARVAPCLVLPTASWAASTTYAADDTVRLPGGEALKVTVAGTSGGSEPPAPALGVTVTDGTVTWERIAPTADQLADAKLVLIGAITRWAQTGAGGVTTETAGPFGVTVDTRQRTGYNLWPSEITGLQDICKGEADPSGAFSIDTWSCSTVHAAVCALYFGATYCSCGADIAGFPLYEVDCAG